MFYWWIVEEYKMEFWFLDHLESLWFWKTKQRKDELVFALVLDEWKMDE